MKRIILALTLATLSAAPALAAQAPKPATASVSVPLTPAQLHKQLESLEAAQKTRIEQLQADPQLVRIQGAIDATKAALGIK